MAFGFELSSASLAAVLDENSLVPYRVAQGYWPLTKSGVNVIPMRQAMATDVAAAAPMVLVRPDAYDKYVGAFAGSADAVGAYDTTEDGSQGSPYFVVTGQTGFHWQVYATDGAPLVDATAWGAEIYSHSGQVLYSSRRRHVRLRQVIELSPAMLVGSEVYVPLSGYTSMPWLMANNLPMTGAGIGEYSEYAPCLMAKVHHGNSGITFCWRDAADNQAPGFYGADGFRKLDASNGFDAMNGFFFAGNYHVSIYVNEEV